MSITKYLKQEDITPAGAMVVVLVPKEAFNTSGIIALKEETVESVVRNWIGEGNPLEVYKKTREATACPEKGGMVILRDHSSPQRITEGAEELVLIRNSDIIGSWEKSMVDKAKKEYAKSGDNNDELINQIKDNDSKTKVEEIEKKGEIYTSSKG